MRFISPNLNHKQKSSPLNTKSFSLGLGLGMLLGYKFSARPLNSNHNRKIFYLKRWEKLLAARFGRTEAQLMRAKIEQNYQSLCATTSAPTSRVLRFHLYQSILPGLALYQLLLEQGLSRKAALVEIDQIFEASFSASAKLMRLQLPGVEPFQLLRQTLPWSLNWFFPQQGWEKSWVENNSTTLAFNMHSCFYLEVLAAHGARELTTIYCKFDDLMFNSLPAPIRWERSQTLGRGHSLCNFRWTNQPNPSAPEKEAEPG
jgi:hypothetical protein